MEQIKTFNKGYKTLRKGRRSLTNNFYLITSQTYKRVSVFVTNETTQIIMQSLLWFDSRDLISLDTVVVIPDHVRLLGQLRKISLEKIMQQFKSFTAKAINRHLNLSGSIWQAGFHDHAVRKDEDLNQIRLYCLNNPVRAGLTDDFHAYPYWYCRWKV